MRFSGQMNHMGDIMFDENTPDSFAICYIQSFENIIRCSRSKDTAEPRSTSSASLRTDSRKDLDSLKDL